MDKLEELRGYLRQLIAVETLECEDQNWFGQDPKLRSENKEELLNICRLIVNELKEERDLHTQLERHVSMRPGGKPLDYRRCAGGTNRCGRRDCPCYDSRKPRPPIGW